MNEFIIIKYIQKITKQDIKNYATKENIPIKEEELNIIYDYIKTKSLNYLKENQEKILKELKQKLSQPTYQKIIQLYNLYKNKI